MYCDLLTLNESRAMLSVGTMMVSMSMIISTTTISSTRVKALAAPSRASPVVRLPSCVSGAFIGLAYFAGNRMSSPVKYFRSFPAATMMKASRLSAWPVPPKRLSMT